MLAHAFLVDIAAHPADPVPRLVFADWLEDHGHTARAELIRLQLQRAALPADDLACEPLLTREHALLASHGEAWRAELPAIDGIDWGEFHGGFVEEAIALSPEAFLEQSEAIYRAAPIRRLRLRGDGDTGWGARLGTAEATRRLCELNLSNLSCRAAELGNLFQSGTALQGLDACYFAYVQVPDAEENLTYWNHSVVTCPHLWNLRTLSLAGCPMGAWVIQQPMEFCPALEMLDFRDNPNGYLVAGYLAQHVPPGLRALWLTNCGLSFREPYNLIATPRLQRLRVLYLNDNLLTDDGTRILIQHPLPELLDLDLRNTEMTDTGAKALLESPFAEQLRRVWLGGNRFSGGVWDRLRAVFGSRLRG
jgi:uncharacterized protein (TIGR02996 family)